MQTTHQNINKLYQIYDTMKNYPQTIDNYDVFSKFCIKKNFINKTNEIRGRRWDASLMLSNLIFSNKVVCELGARDSILSSYLSGLVKEVHVSDNFDPKWSDLGDEKYWFSLWTKSAIFNKKLFPSRQDAKATSFNSDKFDVVIGTSLLYNGIEKGDSDILKEMVRICKPGGFIYISLELSIIGENYSGTYFYSIDDLTKSQYNGKYGICSGSLLLQKKNNAMREDNFSTNTEYSTINP
jgi:SAM-dependent methyltransferase